MRFDALWPQRSVFPESSPLVCVTFFTCTGTNITGTVDLEQTYPHAITYLEGQRWRRGGVQGRVALRYELAWLDNGGGAEVQQQFMRRGAQIEHLLSNPTNEGLFRAVNDVWFRGRACHAPYVLNLEDDRIPLMPSSATADTALQLALGVELLEEDRRVVGLRMKHEWSDATVSDAMVKELGGPLPWLSTRGGLRYQLHCMTLKSGLVWGAFSMAAVLYNRRLLHDDVGLFAEGVPYDELPYDYCEGQYAVRVGLAGLCTARPQLPGACSMPAAACETAGCADSGAGGRRQCGEGDAATPAGCSDETPVPPRADVPCHEVFIEARPPRARDLSDPEWFFWGTPLHVSNRSGARSKVGPAATDTQPPLPDTEPEPKGGAATAGTAPEPRRDDDAARATREHVPTGSDCKGRQVSVEALQAFNALSAATTAAYASKDYREAAAAAARLAGLVGGSAGVLERFGCLGVNAYYIEFLRKIQSDANPAPASSPPPLHRPAQEHLAPSGASEGMFELPQMTSWRSVPGGDPGVGAQSPIRKLIIQTHRTRLLPAREAQLVTQVVRLHPGWVHLFFDDTDVREFIAERMPHWLVEFEALQHSPIQRVDLFRYLAVYHYGGFYLDTDVLLKQSLEQLVSLSQQGTDARCVFPFEREVTERVHPTLVQHVHTVAMVGQYFFGASPRHPFLAAILRYVRKATLDPEWARVPTPFAGDEDDDKTVHYTTGPALVTRCFFEGGFAAHVRLIFASTLGPHDPAGWGQVGVFGVHLHAGSWKHNGELNVPRLLERAAGHRAMGRHEAAAELLMRVLLHGDYALLGAETVAALTQEYFSCYVALGNAPQADLNVAREAVMRGDHKLASDKIRSAEQLASSTGQDSLLAEAQYYWWLLLSKRAEAAAVHVAHVDREAAQSALRASMRLNPRASRYRYANAAAMLTQSAVYAVQSVFELEAALTLELAEMTQGTSATGVSHLAGDSAAATAVAPPVARANLLYLWTMAASLRGAVLASASLGPQMRALLNYTNTVGIEQCDLELKGGALAGPADLPSDATAETTTARRLQSQAIAHLPEGNELRVNLHGIPVVLKR